MQEEDFDEILWKTKNFHAQIKSISRRKQQIDSELTEQNTLLEADKQNLIEINKHVGKYLYKHPLSTAKLAEREEVVLCKINREKYINTQNAELGRITDEVKQATIQFTKELHEVLSLQYGAESNDTYDEENSYEEEQASEGTDDEEDEQSTIQPTEEHQQVTSLQHENSKYESDRTDDDDDENSYEEESVINLKRVHEDSNNDGEMNDYDDGETKEQPIAKKLKQENEMNQTVHHKWRRAGTKYCYKFLKFEGWQYIKTPTQVRMQFESKPIVLHGSSHGDKNIRYYKCKTCLQKFSSTEKRLHAKKNVKDGKNDLIITLWSETPGKLCACD